MMRIPDTFDNQLLARLAAEDVELLSSQFEPVTIMQGEVLVEAGAPIHSVFFPDTGVVSVVIRSPSGDGAEAGIIGREGFIHPAVLLGADRLPCSVEAQLPCRGHRIARMAFLETISASASLRELLLRFAHAQSVQGSFTCLSYAIHDIRKRLARWLLMCHDRIDGDVIALTHEALAIMLAVRRPSVTGALHVLEGMELIRVHRGAITICDRAVLEALAAGAYGGAEAVYRQVLKPV